jgi:hypothetical protein
LEDCTPAVEEEHDEQISQPSTPTCRCQQQHSNAVRERLVVDPVFGLLQRGTQALWEAQAEEREQLRISVLRQRQGRRLSSVRYSGAS